MHVIYFVDAKKRVIIKGTKKQIESAQLLIESKIQESANIQNDTKNSSPSKVSTVETSPEPTFLNNEDEDYSNEFNNVGK